jgi:hypothetical protein
VLTGVLSIVCGLGVGGLAALEFRHRKKTVDAERHLFGRGWPRDWRWYWALRKANPTIASVIFAAVAVALIVYGVTYLTG